MTQPGHKQPDTVGKNVQPQKIDDGIEASYMDELMSSTDEIPLLDNLTLAVAVDSAIGLMKDSDDAKKTQGGLLRNRIRVFLHGKGVSDDNINSFMIKVGLIRIKSA